MLPVFYENGAEEEMDRRMILKSDVEAVLKDYEASGEAVEDPEKGWLAASARIGNVTFWVKFTETEKGYLVYINMPDGLKSDNNHTLSFAETMYGKAEIITVRKKLIFMLFNRLKAITSSNKKQEDLVQPATQENSQERSATEINF